ncbi:MAG: copper-binding protein, partial [Nitrosopumilaceae archaeon]
MTSVDKAAIGWSIAIVAIGVAIAGAGMSGVSFDTGSPAAPAPVMKETTLTKSTIPGYDRLTSTTDPGIGHETHQLAIILPPSDKVYSGTLRYDASEPIQLVSLVGPLKAGNDKGQPIWTPDGTTKFALTFVDPKKSNGEWNFAGNALAVHTMKTTPFIVDYKITDLSEKPKSDTVLSGTISSTIDPGIGHESHSLAVIIPPSDRVYSGTLSYSASENIQLVSLKGPLKPGETSTAIWSPDGITNFALTFVDPKNQMGTWKFSGNALALHTMNTKGFTASYAVSSEKSSGVTVSAPKVTEPPK